jgi:hypothetical protein
MHSYYVNCSTTGQGPGFTATWYSLQIQLKAMARRIIDNDNHQIIQLGEEAYLKEDNAAAKWVYAALAVQM